MNDINYNLWDTFIGKVLKSGIVLPKATADTLNYAYALNGVSKKYIESTDEALDFGQNS